MTVLAIALRVLRLPAVCVTKEVLVVGERFGLTTWAGGSGRWRSCHDDGVTEVATRRIWA